MTRLRPRRWREWTLRSRMTVLVVGLAAVGLLVAGATGMILLSSSLTARVDDQLNLQSRQIPPPRPIPEGWTVGSDTRRGSSWPGAQFVTRFYTVDGTVLHGPTNSPEQPDLGTYDELLGHLDHGPYTVSTSAGRWRVLVAPRRDSDGFNLVAISLTESDTIRRTLLLITVTASLLVLGGIGTAAAAVVGVGLRPLHRMQEAAAEIAAGDLSRRVDDDDPHTEAGRLATALNMMMVRIEQAMAERTASEQRLRQFLADAAHELRTPLTSIQGFAELYARGGARPGRELDEAMTAIGSEVSRMRLLVNDLLLLARLDEERPLSRHNVDLLEVAADTVRDAHLRVPTRFVLLEPLNDQDDTFDTVRVDGDEARLRQVATNLVANALQHTSDDAQVMVRVGRHVPDSGQGFAGRAAPAAVTGHDLPRDAPVLVFEVADTGPGMAATEASRVFERLYRADASRSRRHGGAGLGLSIVAAIVHAHGGRCELFTAPGGGARFRVLLPVSEQSADSEPS